MRDHHAQPNAVLLARVIAVHQLGAVALAAFPCDARHASPSLPLGHLRLVG